MNLVCVVVLLVLSGIGVASLALAAVRDSVLDRVRGYAPAARVRWLLALLALPSSAGVLAVVIGFGPCLGNLIAGLPDTCQSHGGPDFFFCLRMQMHDVPVAWMAAGAMAVLVGPRLVAGGRVIFRARAAVTQLERLGSYDAERDIWLVPGGFAIVSGWPRSRIYVGQTLEQRFSHDTFRTLLAHERAHRQRRDLDIKLLARGFALCLLGFLRQPLLDELDLAIEQACDALAAEEVRDPLVVAQSLIEVAGNGTLPDGLRLAFCASKDHLEARVRALCDPSWVPSARAAKAFLAVGLCVVVTCIAFDPHLHDLTEAMFERILG